MCHFLWKELVLHVYANGSAEKNKWEIRINMYTSNLEYTYIQIIHPIPPF